MEKAALPALLMRKDSSVPTDLEPVGGLFGKTATERQAEMQLSIMKDHVAMLQSQMQAMRGVATEFYSLKLKAVGKGYVPLKAEKDIRALQLEEELGLMRDKDGMLVDVPKNEQPPPGSWTKQETTLRMQWGGYDTFKMNMVRLYTSDTLKMGF